MNISDRIPRSPQRDIRFAVAALLPQRSDRAELAGNVRGDDDAVESMLIDQRLFDPVMGDEAIVLHVMPPLLLSVLLRYARRELRQAK